MRRFQAVGGAIGTEDIVNRRSARWLCGEEYIGEIVRSARKARVMSKCLAVNLENSSAIEEEKRRGDHLASDDNSYSCRCIHSAIVNVTGQRDCGDAGPNDACQRFVDRPGRSGSDRSSPGIDLLRIQRVHNTCRSRFESRENEFSHHVHSCEREIIFE
jgi:hypothetical protein